MNSPEEKPINSSFLTELLSSWRNHFFVMSHSLPHTDTLAPWNKLDTASVQQAAGNKHFLKPTGSKVWNMALVQESQSFRRMGDVVPGSTTGSRDEKRMEYSCSGWQQEHAGKVKFPVLEFDADESEGLNTMRTSAELQRFSESHLCTSLVSVQVCSAKSLQALKFQSRLSGARRSDGFLEVGDDCKQSHRII